jgi:uncharacterized Rmd1/YagE family protein
MLVRRQTGARIQPVVLHSRNDHTLCHTTALPRADDDDLRTSLQRCSHFTTRTSYSLNRNATALQDGQYDQGAYARLWASISYNHSVPFTTTASPTPVASIELVYPPALYSACPESENVCIDCYKLPEGFIWGVSSSAFQIEGGLTEDGRGPAAMDVIGAIGYVGREPGEIDAEVATMSYYLYKQDIARLAAIGIPYFSFSISWTRIVPFSHQLSRTGPLRRCDQDLPRVRRQADRHAHAFRSTTVRAVQQH